MFLFCLKYKFKILLSGLIFFMATTLNAQTEKITCHEFMENPFPHPVSIEAFKDNYWWRIREKQQPTENIHIKNKIDTLRQVLISQSIFYFYDTGKKVMFYKADIYNRRIKLIGGIRTGMKRDDFFAVFKNLKFTDQKTIKIYDKDKISSAVFQFKGNRLREIHIEYYID